MPLIIILTHLIFFLIVIIISKKKPFAVSHCSRYDNSLHFGIFGFFLLLLVKKWFRNSISMGITETNVNTTVVNNNKEFKIFLFVLLNSYVVEMDFLESKILWIVLNLMKWFKLWIETTSFKHSKMYV